MTQKSVILYLLSILLAALACTMPGLAVRPTETATVQPTPAVTLALTVESPPQPAAMFSDIPTRGSGKAQVVYDQVSQATAAEKRAFGGDDFNHGRLERPFTQDMVYLPWLDIEEANMVWDASFAYYMLRLVGSPGSASDGQPPAYGIEVDTDLDSRGDLLLLSTGTLAGEWSPQGVQVWEDANGNIGGYSSVYSDPPAGGGDGYEQQIAGADFGMAGDLAWARQDPLIDDRIELAIHPSLLRGVGALNWRAFADGMFRDSFNFDPNDRFTIDEAGSADKNSPYYPLKGFYAYDNTCIAPYNYRPQGDEPGLCLIQAPESGAGITTPGEQPGRSADPGGPGVWIPEPGANPP